MQLTGNTVLITGGGSGIGRALAEQFHQRKNKVIIAGRRRQLLEETVAANPGMAFYPFDVEKAESIQALAATLSREHADLNVLINNAGIMRVENLLKQTDTATAEAIVTTNLLGPLRLTTALLPLLLKMPHSTIMNVSSGLATVPLAFTPTYCATKAAIHSYTESLRYQLRDTNVEVLELTPPYVATDLLGDSSADPRAMPLADFINEVMKLLAKEPAEKEICVERVKPLRDSVRRGDYETVFSNLNQALAEMIQ